jgi:hypothetical protein
MWSKWESIWTQLDEYNKTTYEVFKKTNNNWLSKYKKVKIISSKCYPKDVKILK